MSARLAAHAERGRADRAAKVEREDAGARIASKLHRHQRQQHGLACAGWADDHHMTDIADMKRKAERGGALGFAEQERGITEMLVPFRPRPHGGEGDHVGEIEG